MTWSFFALPAEVFLLGNQLEDNLPLHSQFLSNLYLCCLFTMGPKRVCRNFCYFVLFCFWSFN